MKIVSIHYTKSKLKTYRMPEYKRERVVKVDLITSLGLLRVVYYWPHPVLTHVLLRTWLRYRCSKQDGANSCCWFR